MPDHVADFATVDTVAVTGAGEKTFADPGVKDIGWNEPPSAIPAPFVAGVQNDELWTLVRRFNKQMYHVKATDVPAAPGVLDLKIAEEEDFSPDKLRANFERLYVTVIIGMLGFTKHLARLSSWNEPIRTGYFCMVYFAAWWLDLLLPFFLSLIVLLTAYPPARDYLFPPAPLALVSSKTGNLQTPRAGTLGSGDSLTGAVEEHPGEAVEQEASNFLTGFASLAVGTILGKHPDGDADEEKGKSEPIDKMIPDPSNLAATSVDVKDQAQGKAPGTKSDPTKQPMEVIIWTKARPVMRMIADLADVWEMFANAMSPTPPFNHVARLRLAYVVTPLILVTAFVNGAMIVKSVGFGVGCGVFGRPVLTAAAHWLNRVYPQWPQLLDLRKTLLLGVPTNAQLTLTLLRLGEANHVPLPPPPASEGPPPSQPSSPIVKHEDLPEDLKASELEVNPAPESAPEEAHGHGEKTDTKHKVMSKIAGLLKGGAKVGVSSVLGTDRLKAAFGSEKAKERLGVLPARDDRLVDGPSMFSARFHGKKGHVVISSTANPPCVSFVRDDAKRSADGAWEPVFSIALNDINELKKVGGLSWKGKLVVGWAYERPVYDGLDIVDARGETWTLRAMQRRDELFNRLLASVSHQWESW